MPSWKKLQLLNGSAAAVPKHIKGLSSAKTQLKAYAALRESLTKAGTWSEAAVPAAAEILTVASGGSAPAWWLLADLAASDALAYLANEPQRDGHGHEVRAQLAAAEAQVVAATSASAASDRAGALHLLGYLPGQGADAITARLDDEDEQVAATAWLAIARWRLCGAEHPADAVTASASDRPIVRACAAVAARAGGADVPHEAIAAGLAARLDRKRFPWGEGMLEEVLTRIAEQQPEHRESVLQVGISALREVLSRDRGAMILALSSGMHRFGKHAMVPVDQLTTEERRIAELVAEVPVVLGESWGMPPRPRDRRRWLGVADPGIFEAETELADGRRGALWQRWTELCAAGEEGDGIIPDELRAGRSDAEVYLMVVEMLLGAYRIPAKARRTFRLPQLVELAREAPADLDELAQLADELAALGGDRYARSTTSVMVAWPLARAGREIPPSWDCLIAWVPREVARDLLAPLSPERREAIVWRELQEQPQRSDPKSPKGLQEALDLLDLAPSKRIAAVVATKLHNPRCLKELGFSKIDPAPLLARLEEIAASEPQVREALDDARAEAGD